MSTSAREKLIAAIAGAVLAACATVALYECGAGGSGQQSASVAGAPQASGAATSPPSADATREQLLARDAEQRRLIEAASAKIARLEQQQATPQPPQPPGALGAPGEVGWAQEHPDDDPLAPSADTLARWAKSCTLNYDYPPMHNPEPAKIEEPTATSVGLSAKDLATANKILARQYQDWHARVRELYVEVVGPTPGLEDLSLLAMTIELDQKGGGGPDSANLNRRLAQERAGQVAPPTPGELAKASAYERYYRELVGLGNQTEALLAAGIGAELAHKLRANIGGWGSRVSSQGCMDAEPAPGDTRIETLSN